MVLQLGLQILLLRRHLLPRFFRFSLATLTSGFVLFLSAFKHLTLRQLKVDLTCLKTDAITRYSRSSKSVKYTVVLRLREAVGSRPEWFGWAFSNTSLFLVDFHPTCLIRVVAFSAVGRFHGPTKLSGVEMLTFRITN